MNSFGLTPEQLDLQKRVREFADTVVAPAAYQYDTERRLPMEIIAQMGEMGLFGLPFPKEYGGQGGTYVDLCIAIEALARVDQSIAVTLEAGRRTRHHADLRGTAPRSRRSAGCPTCSRAARSPGSA